MSDRRNILVGDEEYFAIKEGLNRRKAELKEVGLRASFAGVGLALLRALHAGRIAIGVLKGMNKAKAVSIKRKGKR